MWVNYLQFNPPLVLPSPRAAVFGPFSFLLFPLLDSSTPRLLGPPVVTRKWILARHVEGHLISLNAHRGPSIEHRGGSLEELWLRIHWWVLHGFISGTRDVSKSRDARPDWSQPITALHASPGYYFINCFHRDAMFPVRTAVRSVQKAEQCVKYISLSITGLQYSLYLYALV